MAHRDYEEFFELLNAKEKSVPGIGNSVYDSPREEDI